MSGVSNVSNSYPSYASFASGKKINSAADGAAELSIIENQEKDIGGLAKGSDNIKSAQETLNISDGALSSVTDSLQRMRELAIQSMNGIYSDSDKQSIQDEIDQLKKGISNITSQTEYNGKKLLDGSTEGFDVVTNSKGDTQSVSAANSTLEALGIADFDVTKDFDLKTLDKAIDTVSAARSKMGAQSNALDYAYDYNSISSYNLNSSQSKLEDLDYAKAISEKKKEETLQQYQTMMQKNQMEQQEQQMRNWFL